jgi:hypothetical protein
MGLAILVPLPAGCKYSSVAGMSRNSTGRGFFPDFRGPLSGGRRGSERAGRVLARAANPNCSTRIAQISGHPFFNCVAPKQGCEWDPENNIEGIVESEKSTQ